MAPSRKRENRENQFYNVGVQGRKTGITLEDRGVRDEHGLEPISGIFSSPAKSPPKRAPSSRTGDTVTESESMDIQESSIPELATSTHLLRNSRTHFPPPKARSPMKTALGSSPRRQSSMGPRAHSANPPSSPLRAASHPAVSRLLDFEQEEESSLQETPALSGSGMRRGRRADVYEIALSPIRGQSEMLEESVQEEIIVTGDSVMITGAAEESYIADVGNDTTTVADANGTVEESEVVSEPPKQPAKRGRKRKSEAMEPPAEEQAAPKGRRRGAAAQTQAPETQKKRGRPVAPAAQPRRSKRVSEITENEPSAMLDASVGGSDQIETPPVAVKPRGRPPKAKAQTSDSEPTKEKTKQKIKGEGKENENEEPAFKKPKLTAKPKKSESKSAEQESGTSALGNGRLVDVHGKPISKADIDQMSVTSVGSRYGRGRHLSVFRELDPDAIARVGRTGRHRVKPIDFWRNESVLYDDKGNMKSIVKNALEDPVPRKQASHRYKPKKQKLSAVEEEEEVELEPWEEDEGVFEGRFREYDPATEFGSNELIESIVAWAPKGINPTEVSNSSFKFAKLASAGEENFLSWGFIDLGPDQMKRTKNARRMHMVFHVHAGVVQAKIHENEFLVHRGGVFQVPRGNTYSIKNMSSGTSRIFFAQGCEARVEEAE
ncbi:hypothetical protein K458DRAFT_475324 [Lentithecium fluviatile CBS 122367]|uniref:CENP-C homolog n=1 Tax=Lentithecium fluviatile CBS 122367 TaxID=1168545 RepID=A0A6G1JEP0_9PLEO|nr:hypothetical protein K458DRAFT_475324 [Lentithecium fluviatile CBS 122367]